MLSIYVPPTKCKVEILLFSSNTCTVIYLINCKYIYNIYKLYTCRMLFIIYNDLCSIILINLKMNLTRGIGGKEAVHLSQKKKKKKVEVKCLSPASCSEDKIYVTKKHLFIFRIIDKLLITFLWLSHYFKIDATCM